MSLFEPARFLDKRPTSLYDSETFGSRGELTVTGFPLVGMEVAGALFKRSAVINAEKQDFMVQTGQKSE